MEEISHALIIRDGKYLAVRNPKDSYWKLPGGGIESGETAEEALRRELKEEIGITEIASMKKIHEFDLNFKSRNFRFHSYLVKTPQEPIACDIEEKLYLEWQQLNRMQNAEDQAPSQQILYNRILQLGLVEANL